MDFYLSSRAQGRAVKELKKMAPKNKKTALISNALDYSKDFKRRKKSEEKDAKKLSALGFNVELVDLRKYFGKKNKLKTKMKEFGVIWIKGGNVFYLRNAMKQSGFDQILKSLSTQKNILYGGASAGICILSPTLKGLDLIDSTKKKPYEKKIIWEGLNIIPYCFAPHYKSRNSQSKKINKVVEYFIKNKIPFKTLKDKEVITINKGKEKVW